MLFGDADVEHAVGELFAEEVEAGAIRHGGGDGDDALVLAGFGDEAIGEDAGVSRGVGFGLHLRAGHDVELGDAVVFVVGFFGGRVSLALARDDVDEDRPLLGVADILQDGKQGVEVVAVNGTDVVEAQLLEPHAALPEVAGVFFHARGAAFPALGQPLGELLGDIAPVEVGAARGRARKVMGQCPDGGRDRHVVVVQDDDEAFVAGAGVVDGFVSHARAHGAVADDGDDVVRLAFEVAGAGHAQRGRDGRGRMAGAEGVVFAFRAPREARKAAALAQRPDAIAAAGEDLVRIGLVADVPDDAVAGRVEDPMQRDGQFDDAETGA